MLRVFYTGHTLQVCMQCVSDTRDAQVRSAMGHTRDTDRAIWQNNLVSCFFLLFLAEGPVCRHHTPVPTGKHMQHSIDNTTDACTRYAMAMQQAHGHVHHGDANAHAQWPRRRACAHPALTSALVCQWLAQPSRAGAELTQAIISAQLSSAQLSSMAPASSSQALLSTTNKIQKVLLFFLFSSPFSTYYNVKIAIHCCYCHCCHLSCLCCHALLPLMPPVTLPHATVHCCTHVCWSHCCALLPVMLPITGVTIVVLLLLAPPLDHGLLAPLCYCFWCQRRCRGHWWHHCIIVVLLFASPLHHHCSCPRCVAGVAATFHCWCCRHVTITGAAVVWWLWSLVPPSYHGHWCHHYIMVTAVMSQLLVLPSPSHYCQPSYCRWYHHCCRCCCWNWIVSMDNAEWIGINKREERKERNIRSLQVLSMSETGSRKGDMVRYEFIGVDPCLAQAVTSL